MLIDRVLEPGREVDLGRLDRREAVEQLVGESRRPVLDRAGKPILAGDLTEFAQDLEIELDLGDPAVRQRDTSRGGPGLDADLRDARGARRTSFQLAALAVEVCPQLLDRRVLGPDLADLATDADRHAV